MALSCTLVGCPPGDHCVQVSFNKYQCQPITSKGGGYMVGPNHPTKIYERIIAAEKGIYKKWNFDFITPSQNRVILAATQDGLIVQDIDFINNVPAELKFIPNESRSLKFKQGFFEENRVLILALITLIVVMFVSLRSRKK